MSVGKTFRFTGRDSLAQVKVIFGFLFGGGCPAMVTILWGYGTTLAIILIPLGLTIAVGLRSSIVVSDCDVTVTRLWFSIPLWAHTGQSIEEIWFGGNWGLDDDALGVVVNIDGKEIHLGSPQTMHYLYDSLQPYLKARPDLTGPERHEGSSDEERE